MSEHALNPVAADEHGLKVRFNRQREAFRRVGTPTAQLRRGALKRLQEAILSHSDPLEEAISADFGNRSRHETRILELFPGIEEIRHARRHVQGWLKERRRPVSVWFQPGRARVVYQPLGVVGVIVPWNYPLYLALGPLAGALAAGNRVMIKMSEFAPRTAEVFRQVIATAFGEDEVAVVTGGPEVARAFARLPFDHLLFTGSASVGRAVMRAASENLTPVTLELGGKSPAIIGPTADFERAVNRILVGKLLNAGQTCIAPDYVLVPQGTEERFAQIARQAVARRYPDLNAPDYTGIINAHHYRRLQGYLEDARSQGAELIDLSPPGGGVAEDSGKLAPWLILRVNEGMRVMQDEIFGPLLPLVTYRYLEEAIGYVNERPRPLALYYFDTDGEAVRKVLAGTVSGGVTVNDTIVHIAQTGLPFGGVGASGMGHYHGRYGFLTFSKQKGVFYQSRFNALSWLSPPFNRWTDWILRFMLRK